MTVSIRSLIDLVAPHYLLIAIFSPLAAYMVINGSFPTFDIVLVISSLCFAVLGFNTTNAIFDLEIDSIEKPLRPLPSGKIKIKEARAIAIAFYFLSLFTSFFVSPWFLAIIILFLLVSYFYSAPPIFFKKYSWGSSLAGTVLYGVIPFLGAYSISSSENLPLVFLGFFSVLIAIISNTKDFEDAVSEKKYGIGSLPIMFGEELAALLIIFGEFFVLLFMGFLSVSGIIPLKFLYASLFSVLLLMPVSTIFWRDIKRVLYKNIIYKKFNSKKIKDIIFQSEAVTISVLYVLVVQLVFGLFATSLF